MKMVFDNKMKSVQVTYKVLNVISHRTQSELTNNNHIIAFFNHSIWTETKISNFIIKTKWFRDDVNFGTKAPFKSGNHKIVSQDELNLNVIFIRMILLRLLCDLYGEEIFVLVALVVNAGGFRN